jgi:hypothetical protein
MECVRLLGAELLGRLPGRFDIPGGSVVLSSNNLRLDGDPVELGDLMGFPIVSGRVSSEAHRVSLDSGAQISYLQHDSL